MCSFIVLYQVSLGVQKGFLLDPARDYLFYEQFFFSMYGCAPQDFNCHYSPFSFPRAFAKDDMTFFFATTLASTGGIPTIGNSFCVAERRYFKTMSLINASTKPPKEVKPKSAWFGRHCPWLFQMASFWSLLTFLNCKSLRFWFNGSMKFILVRNRSVLRDSFLTLRRHAGFG